jgi:hypothetical protein
MSKTQCFSLKAINVLHAPKEFSIFMETKKVGFLGILWLLEVLQLVDLLAKFLL